MKNGFEIRQATFGDIADIAFIHVKAWQQAYIGQIPQDYLNNLNVEDRRKKWEELFRGNAAEDDNLYLAIQNGKVTGFISFGRARDDGKIDQGEIYAVYLLQEFWGNGMGYALFKTATQSLLSNGYTKIYLWVLDTNQKAIRSYTQWGGIVEQSVKSCNIGGQLVKEISVTFNLSQEIKND